LQEQLTTKLTVAWPTPQDYNEAVQNLKVNIGDPELQACSIATDAMGLPRPITGAFASVYQVHGKDRDYALRCFLRDIPDSGQRYQMISEFVQHDTLPSTVTFDFQQKGIKVGANWFPALKMEWVAGDTLDNYVRANKDALPAELAETFKAMCLSLNEAGIAHGDLQHGNIIIRDSQLFLVDYDGMFVPEMHGYRANELGHRNYQHPRRSPYTFGAYLDNFSAWVIYTSLRALSLMPELFDQLVACEDCLLFRREDFVDPLSSPAFAALERSGIDELAQLSQFLRFQIDSVAPEFVPSLSAPPTVPAVLPEIAAEIPTHRPAPEQESRPLHPMVAAAREAAERRLARHVEVTATNPLATEDNIEPELLNPTPRLIAADTAGPLPVREKVVPGFAVIVAIALMSKLFQIYGFGSMLMGFLMVAIAAWSLCPSPGSFHYDLIANGIPVRGRIKEKYRTGPLFTLTYEFHDMILGHLRQGLMNVTEDQYDRCYVGEEKTIVYDTAAVASVIYEFAKYRAVEMPSSLLGTSNP
jgi:hypothetical protein